MGETERGWVTGILSNLVVGSLRSRALDQHDRITINLCKCCIIILENYNSIKKSLNFRNPKAVIKSPFTSNKSQMRNASTE